MITHQRLLLLTATLGVNAWPKHATRKACVEALNRASVPRCEIVRPQLRVQCASLINFFSFVSSSSLTLVPNPTTVRRSGTLSSGACRCISDQLSGRAPKGKRLSSRNRVVRRTGQSRKHELDLVLRASPRGQAPSGFCAKTAPVAVVQFDRGWKTRRWS